MGCGKCGSGSCGCTGKPLLSPITGDMVFDGVAFDCIDDSLDINPGDSLNSILAKIFPVMCLANEKPQIVRDQDLALVLTGGALDIGLPMILPNAGDYHIRTIVSYKIEHNAVLPIEVLGDVELRLDGTPIMSERLRFGGNFDGDEVARTIVMEDELNGITLPQTLQVHSPGLLQNDGLLTIQGYSLYAKRIR
jgi:hypothetical protein